MKIRSFLIIVLIIVVSNELTLAQTPDASQSIVEVETPIFVGSNSKIKVTVKDARGNNITTAGIAVLLSSTSNNVTIVQPTDNRDGTHTGTITSSSAELITIVVTAAAVELDTKPTIQFVINSQEGPTNVVISKEKRTAIHTNFILPLFRFDRTNENISNPKFRTSVFSSLGAGINIARGELTTTMEINSKNDPVSSTFTNHFGAQFGVIFSSVSDNGENENFIGLLMGLTFLDMQVNWGYNFGTRGTDIEGHFFTLAYGIPIQKLTNKGSYIFGNKKRGILKQNNKNPKGTPATVL
ncbi:Ig-like domain-containing protein [Fulvivirgaceae bacterium BMA10]|uniref:Ig-like domain-containing protein n=1 Tax=Splendidivirga corallicola TaxID=3051826 RepID=A0ABT8KL86_9BACT|nr:Ig-like domain-containing protein [Fulvivirgaceae bacterium BMA10]